MVEGLLQPTLRARGDGLLWADLAAHAAHDLNNHLTSVLGKAEIALMSPDPARWQRGLEEILEAGQRARSLVADLQRLARWHLGSEGEIAAPDLLGVVVRLSGRRAERAGIRVEMTGRGSFADSRLAARIALLAWQLVERALSGSEAAAAGSRGVAWFLEAVAEPDGSWELTLRHPGSAEPLPGLRVASEAVSGTAEAPGEWEDVVEACRELGARLVPLEEGVGLRH